MNDRSGKRAAPAPGQWHLEDFRVGQRFTTPQREVTTEDVAAFARLSGDTHPLHTDPAYAAGTRFGRPIAHGPFGIAVAMGLLHRLALVDDTVVALLDTHWRYRAPLGAGDRVHAEVLITGVRRSRPGPDGPQGVVDREVRLVLEDGTVAQEGRLPCLVRAHGQPGEDEDLDVGRAFATAAWGAALAASLNENAAFASATRTWDGTIGLACGERSVQLRVYRGRVLEAVRRTPGGATFTLTATPRTWTELAIGPGNDLVRRANRGEVVTSGDAYEYLRLFKAVNLLVDEVRALAGKEAA